MGEKRSVLWTPEIRQAQQSPNCVKIHFCWFITHIFGFMALFPIKMVNSHKNFFEGNSQSECLEFTVVKRHRRNLTVFCKFNCCLEVIMSKGQNTVYILLSISFFFNRSTALCTSQLFLIISVINV